MYSRETTHFGFPLADASDLTTPMDYNESLEEADTALFEAQTNAAGAVGTAGNALTVANEAKTEAESATATANSATAAANAAATAANEAVAAVAEAKDDALDMICAVVEETATAQYKHEPTKDGLNYYFRYNDILYKTTAVINVGETIVPNTNCAATNVATELNAGAGSTVDEVARAEIGTLSQLETTDKSSLVAAINEVLSEMGGGGAMLLDYSTKEALVAGTSVTTVKNGMCIYHYYASDASSASDVTIDDESIRPSTGAGSGTTSVVLEIPFKAGAVVLASGSSLSASGRGAYIVYAAD